MKSRALSWKVAAVAIAAMCAWAGRASAAPPSIALEADRVSVMELPLGGRVALTGLFRRVNGTIPGFERRSFVLEDTDGDGRVEARLERSHDPSWAVWIAVDLSSGEWSSAGRAEEGQSALLAGGGEVSAGMVVWPVPVGIVEVLVARPGEGSAAGAWGGSSWDGGPADGDGFADGSAGVSAVDLSPVGESGPAPERYAAGDVLVAIEPRALGYVVTRVGGPVGEVAK